MGTALYLASMAVAYLKALALIVAVCAFCGGLALVIILVPYALWERRFNPNHENDNRD